MIEDLIRSAAEAYYASVTKEQLVEDLRNAGFSVYNTETIGQTQFNWVYVSPKTSFSLDKKAEFSVFIQRSEKVELPTVAYRLPEGFKGIGEFCVYGDAA